MEILIAGLVLWSLVHFTPSLAQALKNGLIMKLGGNGYKLLFTILMLTSVALIVYGWRHTEPTFLYALSPIFRHIAMLLVLLAFILLGSANRPSRLGCIIRHPMLMGVAVWSFAHLLVNGDSRSVVLFGGMGVWALLEMVFINRRDGSWVKPSAPTWGRELRGLVISLAVFVVVFLLHPFLTGVALR